MSFRGGRGGGGGRGGRDGGRGGGRGDGGRGRGGGGRGFDEGPPAEICEVGSFLHGVEGEMVCRLTNAMVPYFNAGIYLENKSKVGKVEEVFGPINKVYFTIKTDTGVNASSFKADDKVYIGTDKLLPMSRFTNEQKSSGGRGGKLSKHMHTILFFSYFVYPITLSSLYSFFPRRSRRRKRSPRWSWCWWKRW